VPDAGLVQQRVKEIVGEDSPLMQQARVRAMQTMNERGLVNSSLNTEAGQNAVIAQSLPIATADAAAINAAATNTANAQNTASQFGASAANLASQTNAQLLTAMNTTNANAKNAALNVEAQAQNARSLAVIDNNSKQQLAILQAQNQVLLQSNVNVANMFNQVVKNIADIAVNPNLNAAAKKTATNNMLNMLNEAFRATASISTTDQAAIASLQLGQFFNTTAPNTGATGTATPPPPGTPTPAPTPVPNTGTSGNFVQPPPPAPGTSGAVVENPPPKPVRKGNTPQQLAGTTQTWKTPDGTYKQIVWNGTKWMYL
jgi:hypothetical protein